jgi:uncharacterized membrane protein YccC
LRLWASVCLAFYVAFWLELDNPLWAGTTAALMCQPQLGASLRNGWYRIIGTVVRAVAIVLLTACFPQDRAAFLAGLALWGAACALVATLLPSYLAFSPALAGITVAIVAQDELDAIGGVNGQAFMLAVIRATEICIGVVSAGIILAGTDLGTAPRRLAALFAALCSEIADGFSRALLSGGPELPETHVILRAFTRRVIALDPVIDEAIRESPELRYHSTTLRRGRDGLFASMASWRTVAVHLKGLPDNQAREEAAIILKRLPQELQGAPAEGELSRSQSDATGLRRACETAARALFALSTETPSLRLLADHTEVWAGLAKALNGLALLLGDSAQPVPRLGSRLQVPDWLPAVVNAVRAFVTIGAVSLFWIITEWPNGASAITFATIGVLLFTPRADQAYASVMSFTFGTAIAVVGAAIVKFALLPGVMSFAGFSLALSLLLVPAGALMVNSRQPAVFTAVALCTCVLLAPTNPMTYDTQQFYNAALGIVAGLGAALLAFRWLPPLRAAWRTRRLLALTLRDLRRLATDPSPRRPDDWRSRVYGRLAMMPDAAEPLQRAQLVAALSVGTEIIRLRHLVRRLGLDAELDTALAAVVQGNSTEASARFAGLDQAVASRPDIQTETLGTCRVRSSILAVSETLTEYASYFDRRTSL